MDNIFGGQSDIPEPPAPPPVSVETPTAIATSDIVDQRRAAAARRVNRNDRIRPANGTKVEGGTGLYIQQ